MARSSVLLDMIRTVAPYTTAALVLTTAYVGWDLASRRWGDRRAEQRIADGKRAADARIYESYGTGGGLKLIQFYGYPGTIMEGDKAVACYGVNNAASVRIEPAPGQEVWPSLNRCVDIYPEETTKYSLTATSAEGKTVSASFVLTVNPDPEKAPKILYFVKGRKQNEGGRVIQTLCFETRNAEMVEVQPPAFPPSPLLRGCFYAAPQATTTYKLTARGTRGRTVARQVTVEIP